jgi:hypothetical protein
MLDEEHNEIMQDVRARQAEAWEAYKRFGVDPDGFRREEAAALEKLGFRLEPIGSDGTSRLVRITN